ncbi:GNAT family N-acetyltransferase [Kocuria sp. cx-116]|uniref:GNAT family N-acetyltransferase n=1 Tax=Kocuria sp. cx-116 TaxID=2771378 RepID=UPI002A4E1EB8|nr:GNAT family N-acetyltransferase [Kocuria sp. cx-116]
MLRPYSLGDAAFVQDLYSRPEVQRYIGDGTQRVRTLDEARAKISAWNERYLAEPMQGLWAVCRKDGTVTGSLPLKPIPDSKTAVERDIEIGWHFHPDHRGHGYATEAARAVLEHAFASGLERVVAVTHPANTASRAVCLRLGMTHLGLSDAYYDAACELFDSTAPVTGEEQGGGQS